MQILDFIILCDLVSKSELDKAILLCFYQNKEFGTSTFSMGDIVDLFVNAGLSSPNTSRLRKKLIKDRSMKLLNNNKSFLEFIPATMQKLEREYRMHWEDNETILSHSEILDENKFYTSRHYLNILILQVNSSYMHNCYDACAVLMRRLFEVALILVYQEMGIDEQIKNAEGTYILLDSIVKNAKSNKTINLSRIKSEFDKFRKIGNFSAHRIEYSACRKDIDDICIDYRTMLEELYYKAGLMPIGGKGNDK